MSGVLGGSPDAPRRDVIPVVAAEVGKRVVHRGSRVGGTITRVMPDGIVVRTPKGERPFRFLDAGFLVDGRVVTLVQRRPSPPPVTAPKRTASGSVASAEPVRARVARASRIWVEGIHDAALLERVWGDDLRELGIVVERLDGIDHLAERIEAFDPGPERRLGILVDHLVAGSKEQRIADEVHRRHAPHVMVVGTPYIDIWQAVRPKALGIAAWPDVPRGEDWKTGVCQRLGVGDPTAFWRRLLAAVPDYTVLEPPLIAAVEGLLDALAPAP